MDKHEKHVTVTSFTVDYTEQALTGEDSSNASIVRYAHTWVNPLQVDFVTPPTERWFFLICKASHIIMLTSFIAWATWDNLRVCFLVQQTVDSVSGTEALAYHLSLNFYLYEWSKRNEVKNKYILKPNYHTKQCYLYEIYIVTNKKIKENRNIEGECVVNSKKTWFVL